MHRFFYIAGLIILSAVAVSVGAVGAQEDSTKPEFYTTKVKPIFDANCVRCHGGLNHRGGLSMDTRDSMIKGGHHGPAIVPGDAANSLLVKLIRHEGPKDDPMDMPQRKDKLSDSDIAIVERWVNAGAVIPETPAKP